MYKVLVHRDAASCVPEEIFLDFDILYLILNKLKQINFDFPGATTQYLTHKFHPYPARFIPQIPKTFIELFTKKGDRILDPMCGCGTTLVEAFLSKRSAIGADYNPLAVLISKAQEAKLQSLRF